MKNLILTALLILPMIVSGNEINTLDAAFHKGKEVVACGTLKQVSEFKKGLYLNMDNKYPKQSVTFVIWKDKVEEFNTKFGDIDALVDREVCAAGKVKDYNGRSQITLYNSHSLKIK